MLWASFSGMGLHQVSPLCLAEEFRSPASEQEQAEQDVIGVATLACSILGSTCCSFPLPVRWGHTGGDPVVLSLDFKSPRTGVADK